MEGFRTRDISIRLVHYPEPLSAQTFPERPPTPRTHTKTNQTGGPKYLPMSSWGYDTIVLLGIWDHVLGNVSSRTVPSPEVSWRFDHSQTRPGSQKLSKPHPSKPGFLSRDTSSYGSEYRSRRCLHKLIWAKIAFPSMEALHIRWATAIAARTSYCTGLGMLLERLTSFHSGASPARCRNPSRTQSFPKSLIKEYGLNHNQNPDRIHGLFLD